MWYGIPSFPKCELGTNNAQLLNFRRGTVCHIASGQLLQSIPTIAFVKPVENRSVNWLRMCQKDQIEFAAALEPWLYKSDQQFRNASKFQIGPVGAVDGVFYELLSRGSLFTHSYHGLCEPRETENAEAKVFRLMERKCLTGFVIA